MIIGTTFSWRWFARALALGSLVAVLGGCASARTDGVHDLEQSGDLRRCGESAGNSLEQQNCHAVGLIFCNGKVTANGFVVESTGPKVMVVTTSRALISQVTGKPHEQCRFRLRRYGSGVPLQTAVALKTDLFQASEHADLAVAQLGWWPQGPNWTIDLAALSLDELKGFVNERATEFSFLTLHIGLHRKVVSGHDCAPVPKQPQHLYLEWRARNGGDCPSIGGTSGSPAMVYDPSTRRYEAFCVSAANFTPSGLSEANPLTVSVSCARVSNDLIALVDRLSWDREVTVPEGGQLIDFVKQAEELGYP